MDWFTPNNRLQPMEKPIGIKSGNVCASASRNYYQGLRIDFLAVFTLYLNIYHRDIM